MEREFFMRSHGQVRFVTLSARLQKMIAAGAIALIVASIASLGAMSYLQYRTLSERSALVEREAKIASAEDRVGAYRDDLKSVAHDLEKRQDFLESVITTLPEDARTEDAAAEGSETTETVAKVSAALPEARGLVAIEARQLALVDRLTRFADGRSDRAAKAIRQLGLNPSTVIATADRGAAMGGPLEKIGLNKDDPLDPRFERLAASLVRMNALEAGLEGIPQFKPTMGAAISSSFGYRHDPFDGSTAFHAGLDFSGAMGAPIFAAATGRVSFVGVRHGYGNVVEISHGNGLMTRYAHMSKFGAKVGQRVEAGDRIGAIGSTGRSTGPHLHFEVRINDQPVNPRLFLEKANHVLKEARRPDTGTKRQRG